jgi:aminocarboxymuconate-semialdehyde decarboxylase
MGAHDDHSDAKGAGDVIFCGCDLIDGKPSALERARRPVTVDGRRVKTIDVHAHCLFHEALALMGDSGPAIVPQTRGAAGHFITIEDRFRGMDEQAIDMEILSINPFWYHLDRDPAEAIVRIQNDKLAELSAAHPDRLGAFASLALQFPDLAIEQLDHAIRKLGLRGAAIGGNVAGVDFADPKFHPVWAKAEALGAVLFIHPQGVRELSRRLAGNGWLANIVGNPLDTTIALLHLIFEGTLDKFPGLKILAAHGGGYLPSYMNRSDAVQTTFPQRQTKTLKKKPTEYVKQMYYDSIVFTPEALRHLAAEAGPGQVVMGTDYPFPWTSTSVDHILNTPGLGDAEKVAMLGGTAAKLLGIKE